MMEFVRYGLAVRALAEGIWWSASPHSQGPPEFSTEKLVTVFLCIFETRLASILKLVMGL